MLRPILLLLLLAGPAHATQEYILPTLFDVTDVAADDVLNIRQDPDASAPIIGSLAPGATRIEVVEDKDGWARINSGEATGWVSMRYLAYRTDVWNAETLPEGFRCFGTEPFWGVAPRDGELLMSQPGVDDEIHTVAAVLGTGVFRDPTRAVVAEGMTLVATPQICSDGMSGRLFGLRAEIVLHGAAPQLLSGCCAIQPRPDAP